jgi:hypothetical protein
MHNVIFLMAHNKNFIILIFFQSTDIKSLKCFTAATVPLIEHFNSSQKKPMVSYPSAPWY